MARVNIDNVNKGIQPPLDMECLVCPHAVWQKSIATNYQRDNDYQPISFYESNKNKSLKKGQNSYDTLKCYCKLMHKKTYDVTIIEDTIYQTPDLDLVIECEGNDRGE